MKDEKGFEPLLEFIPFCISKNHRKFMDFCKTPRDKCIWDFAVRECIKACVLEAKGVPGPEVSDMKWLLFDDSWDWQSDKKFQEELREYFEK